MHHPVEPHPERIERPLAHAAVVADLPNGELRRGNRHLLVCCRSPIAHPEGPVDEQDVKPAEAKHGPRPGDKKEHSGGETHPAQDEHEAHEAPVAERALRRDHRREDGEIPLDVVVAGHGVHYTQSMARKTDRAKRGKAGAKPARRAAGRLRTARAGKAAAVKPAGKRIAADRKAAAGALPQWSTAGIEEAFRRFEAHTPVPKGELQHIDPFTLLVAVVLSAQATDAGVNKATPALFAVADNPEKMLALGEERLQDMIKTIGLFRTKAKNVIALSRKLVDEHGGAVPRTREALEALPGVGRKTANVVLNVAFGEPTIAVDTHIFRVGNRTGLAVGKTPLEVEIKLDRVVPAKYKRHAHHWLILHGRYVCLARRPLCERCLIADLCKWPGKTVQA